MDADLCFVNGHEVGKTARKRIRSHVMKGRNAGRTHNRTSRLHLAKRSVQRHHNAVHRLRDSSEATVSETDLMSIPIGRNYEDLFLTFSVPISLTPHSLRIINKHFMYVVEKLFPVHLGLSFDEAKRLWLKVLLTDEAACHCCMSLMEACNGFFSGETTTQSAALHHLSRAFFWIKKRLNSDEALSDSTLGIIIMLILQEQIRREQRDAAIHYEGLRKMIELRGGLPNFRENPNLLLKICKMDIIYALEYGRPMVFYQDNMTDVRTKLESKGLSLHRMSNDAYPRTKCLTPVLADTLSDVSSIAYLFNTIPQGRTLDIKTFEEIFISVTARLIRLYEFQSPNDERNIEAVYHIGLLIFMMTLFLQYDHRRLIDCTFATNQFKTVLDRDLHDLDATLVLWLMALGSIWLLGDNDQQWLTSKMHTLLARLGIKDLPAFQRSITKYPWINKLHDEPSCTVWKCISHCH